MTFFTLHAPYLRWGLRCGTNASRATALQSHAKKPESTTVNPVPSGLDDRETRWLRSGDESISAPLAEAANSNQHD